VVQAGHKVWWKIGHKVWCHPYSMEYDTQPIVYLISKQAVPYRTRGGTCYPGVSTLKIRSLADSSTTYHNGINHLHHFNHCSNHNIDPHTANSHLYGWKTISHKYISQTQYHKGWKTCMTLMTTLLSITNKVWTQIHKVWGISNNIKACMLVCILEKESIYDQYGQGTLA
jgi:hypothetical protein